MAYTLGKRNHFAYNRAAGYHRRQRVLVSRVYDHVHANIGQFFYLIGARIEREEKHIWRMIRHGFKAVMGRVFSWISRFLTALSAALIGVLGDLINPFVKLFSSIKGLISILKEMRGLPFRMIRERVRAFFRYGWERNKYTVERFFSYVLPVICCFLCIYTIRTVLSLNYAIRVSYNGQQIGFVSDESVYDSAVDIIDSRLVDVGEEKWTPKASLTMAVVTPADLSTQDVLANRLLSASGTEIVEATGLYVGGQFYGATTAGDLLQEDIDEVIEPYIEFASTLGDDVEVKFSREVTLVPGVYPANSVVSYENLDALVNSTEQQNIYYSAKRGESLSAIASQNGITVDQLLSLNPEQLLKETIEDDVELLVAEDQSVITVKTTRTQVRTERIPYKSVVTRDSRFNAGYFWYSSYGQDGERTITTEIVYENGAEVSRSVVKEEVTKEPVNQEIIIGTNGIGGGSGIGSGSFVWPTGPGGGISRGFGNGHGGMDIWNSYNTPIYAADSGVVIVSQDTTVGYGRYVIIDHQNGIATLYGHMNQRLVEVGEVVAKGQLIGLMGSTGYSTGSHLHFEVRIGGGYNGRVDPAPWLY